MSVDTGFKMTSIRRTLLSSLVSECDVSFKSSRQYLLDSSNVSASRTQALAHMSLMHSLGLVSAYLRNLVYSPGGGGYPIVSDVIWTCVADVSALAAKDLAYVSWIRLPAGDLALAGADSVQTTALERAVLSTFHSPSHSNGRPDQAIIHLTLQGLQTSFRSSFQMLVDGGSLVLHVDRLRPNVSIDGSVKPRWGCSVDQVPNWAHPAYSERPGTHCVATQMNLSQEVWAIVEQHGGKHCYESEYRNASGTMVVSMSFEDYLGYFTSAIMQEIPGALESLYQKGLLQRVATVPAAAVGMLRRPQYIYGLSSLVQAHHYRTPAPVAAVRAAA